MRKLRIRRNHGWCCFRRGTLGSSVAELPLAGSIHDAAVNPAVALKEWATRTAWQDNRPRRKQILSIHLRDAHAPSASGWEQNSAPRVVRLRLENHPCWEASRPAPLRRILPAW